MVRKTNTSSSKLKRALFFPLSFLSIVIVAAVILILLSVKQDRQLQYKDSVQKVADEFTSIERNYAYIINELLEKRQPVADTVLSQTLDTYTQLEKRINLISTPIANSDSSLNTIISERIRELTIIKELNSLIRAEYNTANALDNYSSCKKKIPFNDSAAKIYPLINACTQYLTEAQSLANDISSSSYSSCKLDETPVYIVNQMVAVHQKLVAFYRYSAQHRTKDAAVADVQYRTASNTANKLPKWNKCITEYLQQRLAN